MSDTPLSLEQAIGEYVSGTPQEQAKNVEAPIEEEQTTQEAAALSESDDETEEQLAEGEEAEQDSEADDDGETVEDDEDQEEEAEEPTFTVTIDGKEEEVSQSELLQGYQRQADYTRKTQALTEQRKHLEAQAEQVTQKQQQAIAILEAIPQQLLGTPPAKPDISLARTDPATYEEQKYAWEQWHALKQGFDQWRGQVVQEREKEQQAKRVEIAKAEGERFIQAFEVKDEAALNAKVSEVQTYLHQTFGYKPEELAGMIDHRAYVIADKARRYDALMAENKPKAELKAKKAKLKPVSSGSAQRKPKRSSARDQANKRFEQVASQPGANLNRKDLLDSAVDAFLAGQGRG